MSDVITCQVHGEQQETFVCRHLAKALETGEHVGFFWSGDPRGDAWCSACETVRVREGGVSGDWNEHSEEFAGITLLCGACYDHVKELQCT